MLKVRNLSVTHEPGQELTNISFVADRGEVMFLIGSNGGGKEHLVSLLANPEARYQGEVTINHYKAKSEPDKVRHLVGCLFQPIDLPLHLTGFEYLELVGGSFGLAPNERAERIIGLGHYFNKSNILYRTIERLSLADRQIIGLIASVLTKPPVVIWEEPFLHLDPHSQKALFTLIADLKKDDVTLVVATNNLNLAEELGDSFLLLENGEALAQGTLSQLAHSAQTSKDLSVIYAKLSKSHG